MPLMEMKKREQGSITAERKYKSLQQRWFNLGKKNRDDKTSSTEESDGVIERNDLVTVLASNGTPTDYAVMGIYNKHYNKWFLMDQKDKVNMKKEQDEKAGLCVWLHGGKVKFDHDMNLYEQQKTFNQINVSDVRKVKDKLKDDVDE